MTCIGDLNKRLVIEDLVTTPDGVGGADTSWAEFANVWAKVRTRHGSEKVFADAPTSTVQHVVIIRHLAGLRPRMRFVDGTRILEILSIVNVDEESRWLSCICQEKSA